MAHPYKEIDAYTPTMKGLNVLGGAISNLHDNTFLTPAGQKARSEYLAKSAEEQANPTLFTGTPGSLETIINFSQGRENPNLGSVEALTPALGQMKGPYPMGWSRTQPSSPVQPAPSQKTLNQQDTSGVLGGGSPGTEAGSGSGYATVGGKRINYRDIGTPKDPLHSRGGIMFSNDPGAALGSQDANSLMAAQREQVSRNAQDIGSLMQNIGNSSDGFADTMRIAGIQAQSDNIQRNIADAQRSSDKSEELAMRKYTADMGFKGQAMRTEAHIKAAELGNLGRIEAAKAKVLQDAKDEGRKDFKDRASGLLKEWDKLNLPPEYAPNLARYASIVAESEDPAGKVFLLGANGPNRAHMALPKAYESVYQAWRNKGYSHNDAAARVAAAANQAGVGLAVPNFQRYQTLATARKNVLGQVEE